MDLKINQIINYLNKSNIEYEFDGDTDGNICGYSSILNYKPNTISWIKNVNKYEEIKNSIKNIDVIVIDKNIEKSTKFKNIFVTENPKLLFFSVLNEFFATKQANGIGKNTYISKSAIIDESVYIGNNCTIDDNVVVKKGTIIGNSVSLLNGTNVGSNCNIKSGAIIGGDGFGYSKEEKIYTHVPHFGKVIIRDSVDIGSNTCIDRGTLDDTIIGNGVKIDNLCHIAHNVIIGDNAMIIANTMIGGSTVIEENCYISTSTIRNQLNIKRDSFIGLGSNVIKNVDESTLVVGNPAKERR